MEQGTTDDENDPATGKGPTGVNDISDPMDQTMS